MLFEDYINLHQIPELGFEEFKTSEYIKIRLSKTKARIDCFKTAVFAFFSFNKAKTLAFRAEEDALPLKEETGLYYAVNNNMHACGHDGHMAMLLNLADVINTYEDYPYNVLLIFQPSEESIGGSTSIIPYLRRYKYEALIGLHVFPKYKKGIIYSSDKAIFGNSTEVDININGKASHVFTYKASNDARKKGIKLINKIEKNAQKEGLFFHVGVFNSGVKRNICPSLCKIKASLRGDNNKVSKNFQNELLKLNNNEISITCSELIPCVKNSYQKQDDLFKKLDVKQIKKTLFLADDFAFYDGYFNTLFFLLGTDSPYFLHDSHFKLDKIDIENGFNFLLHLMEYFQNLESI